MFLSLLHWQMGFLTTSATSKPSSGNCQGALRPDNVESVKEQQEVSMAALAKRVGELYGYANCVHRDMWTGLYLIFDFGPEGKVEFVSRM